VKLLVISSETHEMNEVLSVEQMFRAGLERYHLRKPQWSMEELRTYIERIPVEFHSRVVLHDHYALLKEFHLLGAHYNQRNTDTWKEVPAEAHKSISCHSTKELLNLEATDFQDAFFSPVFRSLSKEGYVPIYTPEEIQQAVKESRVPVIALGGIDPQTLIECEKMGFAGAAVLGSVWQSSDPYEAFHQLCKACPKAELPY
jgi:thiamine-phosphate pyrophosphorylase